MNRLGVVFVVLTAGCTDASHSVYILRNQVLAADCSAPSGMGGPSRNGGTLDVTNPIPGSQLENPGYIFAPLIVNGTAANAPNVHTLFLSGANVELKSNGTPQSNAVIGALAGRSLNKRTQRFAAAITAGTSSGVPYPLIDADQTAAMSDALDGGQVAEVLAYTTVYGTLDGSDVTSDPFGPYPIDVCKGCRIEELGPCADLTKDSTIHMGGNCNLLQDALLSCCTSSTNTEVCPAVVPKTTAR
jgi:hypothetical protein